MKEKIQSLTEEQIAKMQEYRDKWIQIGLSTCTDMSENEKRDVETCVDDVYRVAGLPAPKIKIWLRSPLEGIVGAEMLCNIGQVWAQVGAQVRAQVWAQVRAQVRAQVGAQVGDQVWRCGYGLHDADWSSFYDYFDSEMLHCLNIIRPLIFLSQKTGWWWPFSDAVILTQKPVFICLDEQGRLHHENRMALEYADGFGVYAWHGVRVSENIILSPNDISPDMVLQEGNQEIRRVMLERYGWDRLLKDVHAHEIHRDETGILVSTNRLGEYLDGEDDIARFVLVVDNSTDRKYALRVPPGTQSAREGVAWTFGQDEQQYHPLQEA